MYRLRYRSSVHLDSPLWAKDTARRRDVALVERCRVTAKQFTTMTYIRDLERELRALMQEGDEAKVIRFVKEKALESYRNGLDATSMRVSEATEKLERSVRAS
jgi:hypothetical protein